MTDAGARVTSRSILDRIVALRIPPAYTDVRIAVNPRASIQAWGFDARGRRQYRYHVRAVERSELRKYYRVTRLARDLPTIRAAVTRDFSRPGLSKAKVARRCRPAHRRGASPRRIRSLRPRESHVRHNHAPEAACTGRRWPCDLRVPREARDPSASDDSRPQAPGVHQAPPAEPGASPISVSRVWRMARSHRQ